MKRLLIFLFAAMIAVPSVCITADASLISSKNYRSQQNKEYKQEIKQIKQLFKVHGILANKHDLQGLRMLYADNYTNNDGFNKEIYFKNVEETWEECKDLTYSVKITDVQINGSYASVWVEENATGTVFETVEQMAVAGEIHSKSYGIYHLTRTGDKWLISGETLLSDESSLLYGDARFMNIELYAPSQVNAGETYTATVKIDADENTIIVGSIERDPVTYPSSVPTGPLRAMPQSKILERVLTANKDNINEYTVASLAISKSKGDTFENYKIYMAGLACLMKRVNVVPKNNFLKSEDKI